MVVGDHLAYSLVGFWTDKSGWCWFVVREKHGTMTDKPWLKPTSEQADCDHKIRVNKPPLWNLESWLFVGPSPKLKREEMKKTNEQACMTMVEILSLAKGNRSPIHASIDPSSAGWARCDDDEHLIMPAGWAHACTAAAAKATPPRSNRLPQVACNMHACVS